MTASSSKVLNFGTRHLAIRELRAVIVDDIEKSGLLQRGERPGAWAWFDPWRLLPYGRPASDGGAHSVRRAEKR